jgi:U3 small nucleolar RNA-associated protein 15
LKSFQYSDALDAALETKDYRIIVSILDELNHRDGLAMALSNRDDQGLIPILKFIIKHLTKSQHAKLLLNVSNVILGDF